MGLKKVTTTLKSTVILDEESVNKYVDSLEDDVYDDADAAFTDVTVVVTDVDVDNIEDVTLEDIYREFGDEYREFSTEELLEEGGSVANEVLRLRKEASK